MVVAVVWSRVFMAVALSEWLLRDFHSARKVSTAAHLPIACVKAGSEGAATVCSEVFHA